MEKILIFGGAGSLGNELVKYYTDKYNIVVVSRDEGKHFSLKNKFKQVKTIVCDVREEKRVQEILLQEKPEIIIIAQALKQVDICEKFPEESVKTNILGVMNITNVIKSLYLMHVYSPKLICFVSTDKSCNPITVYGMCKSISEKLLLNMSQLFDSSNAVVPPFAHTTRVVIVRYGNVLSSKGSIIPLFLNQAENNNKFSLTHPKMTRFIMTLSEAVSLIDTALAQGSNGDLWVPQLPSMNIMDLVQYFSKRYNKPYEIIGIRECEKIHEVMLSLEEAIKVDVMRSYFVFNKNNKINNSVAKEYSSLDNVMSYTQLEKFMGEYLATLAVEKN